MKNETVIQQLIETVDRFPDREVFKEKKFGRWEGITWQGLYEEVMLLGRGLIQIGVEKGDGFVILGANCTRWVISDLAAIAVGALAVGPHSWSLELLCLGEPWKDSYGSSDGTAHERPTFPCGNINM